MMRVEALLSHSTGVSGWVFLISLRVVRMATPDWVSSNMSITLAYAA